MAVKIIHRWQLVPDTNDTQRAAAYAHLLRASYPKVYKTREAALKDRHWQLSYQLDRGAYPELLTAVQALAVRETLPTRLRQGLRTSLQADKIAGGLGVLALLAGALLVLMVLVTLPAVLLFGFQLTVSGVVAAITFPLLALAADAWALVAGTIDHMPRNTERWYTPESLFDLAGV